MAELDRMWGLTHQIINAKDWGALQSRPRIFATDVDLTKIPGSDPPELNYMLNDGFRILKPHSPCIVASEITHNPPMATHVRSGISRQFDNDEAMRVMGYPDTILGDSILHGIVPRPGKKSSGIRL